MKLSFVNKSWLKKYQNIIYWSALALLFFLSFFFRLIAFQQTDFANGWDAYFYLIQIKSWIEEGAMHSSDSSLVYPLMRIIYWFLEDYVMTFKLTSSFLASGLVALSFFFLKKKSISWSAFLIVVYFLWSPHLTWFAAQYPKNLLGVNLLLCFILSLKSKWKWLPIVLLVANYFGHRMTFILSGIYYLFFLFGNMFSGSTINFVISPKTIFSFVIVLLLILFVVPMFSGTLSFLDLKRVSSSFSNDPHFSHLTFFNEFSENNRLSFFWKMEIILSVLFYLISLTFLFFRKIKIEGFTLLILCSVLIFPFLEWSLTSMSFRFVLVFILLSPLLLTYIPHLDSRHARSLSLSKKGLGVLLFIFSFFSWKSYDSKIHDAPYSKYAKVTEQTFDFLKNKKPELVIAHNALAEYFTFTTGIDALPWQPEYEIAEENLWRIAADVRLPILRTYLSGNEFKNVKRIGVNYFVIQESVWQKFKKTLKENNELDILKNINTWRNPYKIRPAFLLN